MNKLKKGWKSDILGNVAELQRGFDLPSAKRINGNIPIISSGGISGYHNEAKVSAPGVVTGRYGTIGSVFYVEEDFWPLNTSLWVKNFFRNNPKFVYYLLSNIDFKKFSDKTGVPGVNRNELHSIKVNIPPLNEQIQIAETLSTWDNAIQTTEKLIENSRQQKKALMQRLLSGKGWKEYRLGDIAYITTGNANREDSLLEGEYTFFDRSEDIRRSNKYLFDKEAIIVAGEGQQFTPKYFIGKFDLHQRTYAIMDFKDCIGKFLYYMIDFKKDYFLSQAVGSTVKSLRLPMFQKMKLSFPIIEEQQKIAHILSTADQEIETLQRKLECLKLEKGALMQRLL